MTVSIILKTLNEEKRIGAALDSARGAYAGESLQIIVADSGSSDQTVAIASSIPDVTVVQIVAPAQASCGLGPQLGFQYSDQPFICLMDGDMLLDSDFLKQALAYLHDNPRVAGVTGHVVEMNVDNLEFTRRVQRVSPENRVGDIDRMNGGGVYRRSAIEQIGYFSDRNLHGYEEFDLGVRLRSHGWRLHRLDLPFVQHFGHSINSYKLLLRRWQSKYLRGVGEVLRAASGQPHWRTLIAELPELRLWAVVYLWWLVMLATLIFIDNKAFAGLILLILLALPVIAMSLKQKSLSLGLYSVVAWFFHAAALPLGFFQRRRPPEEWVESRIIAGPE